MFSRRTASGRVRIDVVASIILFVLFFAFLMLAYMSFGNPFMVEGKDLFQRANVFDVILLVVAAAAAAIALVVQQLQGRVELAKLRLSWIESIRSDIVELESHYRKYPLTNIESELAILRSDVLRVGLQVLLKLSSAGSDPRHTSLADHVSKMMCECGICPPHELVKFARPVLKEAWMQVVNQVE